MKHRVTRLRDHNIDDVEFAMLGEPARRGIAETLAICGLCRAEDLDSVERHRTQPWNHPNRSGHDVYFPLARHSERSAGTRSRRFGASARQRYQWIGLASSATNARRLVR